MLESSHRMDHPFYCRDISERYTLSCYWQDQRFHVAVKEVDPADYLIEVAKDALQSRAADRLMRRLTSGDHHICGFQVDEYSAIAVAGEIATGLRKQQRAKITRLPPEAWN